MPHYNDKKMDKKDKMKEMVMEDYIDRMRNGMGTDMGKMQKVEVASPTKEGLMKGLEKASEVVEHAPSKMMDKDEDMMDKDEDMMGEDEEMMEESPMDLMRKVGELQRQIQKMMDRKGR